MLLLAECFTGWAMDSRFAAEESAEYFGLAEGLRNLA